MCPSKEGVQIFFETAHSSDATKCVPDLVKLVHSQNK